MRILTAYLIILILSPGAFASDVQPNDYVFSIADGIACTEWSDFETFRETDPRALTAKLPAGCLVIHGAPPVRLFVEVVRDKAAAICVRPYGHSQCLWFSITKVLTQLSPGQRKV